MLVNLFYKITVYLEKPLYFPKNAKVLKWQAYAVVWGKLCVPLRASKSLLQNKTNSAVPLKSRTSTLLQNNSLAYTLWLNAWVANVTFISSLPCGLMRVLVSLLYILSSVLDIPLILYNDVYVIPFGYIAIQMNIIVLKNYFANLLLGRADQTNEKFSNHQHWK